jgi:hypothetical protein
MDAVKPRIIYVLGLLCKVDTLLAFTGSFSLSLFDLPHAFVFSIY